jgi:hypothetical protein
MEGYIRPVVAPLRYVELYWYINVAHITNAHVLVSHGNTEIFKLDRLAFYFANQINKTDAILFKAVVSAFILYERHSKSPEGWSKQGSSRVGLIMR